MQKGWFIGAAALLGLGLAFPSTLARADGKAARRDILAVNELKRGMKGYGLTVFEGTKPERFDVEIIDVLTNFRPRQELILVKTKHPRLEVAKVVAGMSGSPIYIDGKRIGAYAYGWSFGAEPVAGVTPIRTMLDELALPLPDSIDGWPLRLVPGPVASAKAGASGRSGGKRFRGELGRYDVLEHAREVKLASATTQGERAIAAVTPVATPLLMGGMTPGAIRLASDVLAPLGLEPMQAGGGGDKVDPSAPTRYEDGGAIGVQLIRGDMSAMGLGTVTRVEGDRLVAFGHPMMEAGVTALPTAIGRVAWFLASEQRSFKLGMPVRPVGALVNDRVASIVCSHSATAPIVPVTVTIQGVPGVPVSTWNFEIAHEKFMTPTFLSVAVGSALQTVASEHQDVTWTAKSKLEIQGFGAIELEDYGVAIGGTPDAGEFARSNLVRAVGGVLNNPWQPARIERATMTIELRYARDILRLRGAELLDAEIDAGQPARVRLTLVPFVGRELTKTLSVPLPARLAGKTVTLEIGPGYQEDRDKAAPNTLAELVKNLEDPVFPPRSLVVSYSAGDATVTHRGRVAANLPLGMVDTLRPTTTSIAPDAYATNVRQVFPLDQYLVGKDKVSVVVRPVVR
jgi:hypothetical protein